MLKNQVLWGSLIAIGVLSGCAQMAPAPSVSAAAGPAPAGAPARQHGRSAELAASKLAPHAGKLTATPAADIPIRNLKLPAGFKAEIWSHGAPGGRAMARGESGKIYIGTCGIGRVYEITDNGRERTSRVVVDKLNQPAVAIHNGSLYVMAIDKVLRFDGIENNPNVQPVDLTAKDNMSHSNSSNGCAHRRWHFHQARNHPRARLSK